VSFTSDWLIGSVRSMPAYAYSVSASVYGIAAGDYYLYDAANSRSMLYQLEEDIEDKHPGQGAAVFLTETGHVRITCGVAFSITWSDVEFRNWLGFNSDIVSQTAVTASNKSPLFWSPSYPGTPKHSPYGIDGTKIYDTAITESPSGQTSQATRHHTKTVQGWSWTMVPIARVWTTDGDGTGGEFRRFYDEVLSKLARFKFYTNITEETTSTTAFTPGVVLGPYKARGPVDDWYSRGIPGADTRSPISIDATKTAEYA